MSFLTFFPQFEDFPAQLACCGYNNVFAVHFFQQNFCRPFPGHGIGIGIGRLCLAGQSAFANHQGSGVPGLQNLLYLRKHGSKVFFCCCLIDNLAGHAQQLQLRQGNLPLLHVLRLILHRRFSPPANDQ